MSQPPDPTEDAPVSWLDRSVGSAPTEAQTLRLAGALVVTLVTACLIAVSTRLTLARIDEFVLVEWLFLPVPGVIAWRYIGYWYQSDGDEPFTFRNAIDRTGRMCCFAMVMFTAWFLLSIVVLPFNHLVNVLISAVVVYFVTGMVLPQTEAGPVYAWTTIPGESLMQRRRPPVSKDKGVPSRQSQSVEGVSIKNATARTVDDAPQDNKRPEMRTPKR